MDTTISYYDQNAEDFCRSTLSVDFSEIQNAFIKELPKNAQILDLGCGSGRDSLAFLRAGYAVTPVDGSAEICRITEETLGIPVRQMDFEDLSEVEAYDGVFACASLLHLPFSKLTGEFQRISDALRPGGIFYASFKYGDFEGMRNGRYFTDLDETRFNALIREIPKLETIRLWKTVDVRPGREDETWLNVLMRKT